VGLWICTSCASDEQEEYSDSGVDNDSGQEGTGEFERLLRVAELVPAGFGNKNIHVQETLIRKKAVLLEDILGYGENRYSVKSKRDFLNSIHSGLAKALDQYRDQIALNDRRIFATAFVDVIPSHNSEVGCDAPSFATAIHSELQLIATGCNPFFRITSSNITPYCVWTYLAHRNYYVFPRISCNPCAQGLDTTVLPGSLRRYGRTELSPVLAGEPGSGFGNVTVKLAVIPPSGNRKSHYL
jgi:hypothetical protein